MSVGEREQAESIRCRYEQGKMKVRSMQALTTNKPKQEDFR